MPEGKGVASSAATPDGTDAVLKGVDPGPERAVSRLDAYLPGAEAVLTPGSPEAPPGVAIGAAMACYDEARQYAMSRVQFDRPIGGFQLVQAKLARMLTEITKAQLLTHRLAQLKDAGTARHYHISMAKMNNVEIALDAARTNLEKAGVVSEGADTNA